MPDIYHRPPRLPDPGTAYQPEFGDTWGGGDLQPWYAQQVFTGAAIPAEIRERAERAQVIWEARYLAGARDDYDEAEGAHLAWAEGRGYDRPLPCGCARCAAAMTT